MRSSNFGSLAAPVPPASSGAAACLASGFLGSFVLRTPNIGFSPGYGQDNSMARPARQQGRREAPCPVSLCPRCPLWPTASRGPVARPTPETCHPLAAMLLFLDPGLAAHPPATCTFPCSPTPVHLHPTPWRTRVDVHRIRSRSILFFEPSPRDVDIYPPCQNGTSSVAPFLCPCG
jgi:hypothetical protein